MKLIAGHDTIEFGWNICTWIPYLRYMSTKFEEIVAVCNPENRYLYEDFTNKFEDYVEPDCKPDMYLIGQFPKRLAQVPYKILDKVEYRGYRYKAPDKQHCTRSGKKFFKYGQFNSDIQYDIVIHARAEDKYGQAKLNYSPNNYEYIVNEFKGLKICSIGRPSKAYHIKGTEDMRGVFMKYLCSLLAHSKLIIGTSSGPLHLASLCGCPQVVITGNKWLKSIEGTNRDRYEKLWNPFNTPVTVLDEDNWHPHPKKVIKAIRSYI